MYSNILTAELELHAGAPLAQGCQERGGSAVHTRAKLTSVGWKTARRHKMRLGAKRKRGRPNRSRREDARPRKKGARCGPAGRQAAKRGERRARVQCTGAGLQAVKM